MDSITDASFTGPMLVTTRPNGRFCVNRADVKSDYALLELTNRSGEIAAVTLVSMEDLPRVLSFGRWCLQEKKSTGRSYVLCTWYEGKDRHKAGLPLHRFIMDAPSGFVVDHINGNSLDNRRENLRLATPGQNSQNRQASSNSTSGVKNVYWNKRKKRWIVYVKVGGKAHYFGLYTTVEEAAVVAEYARRLLHTHCPENSSTLQSPDLNIRKGVTPT